MHKRLSGLLSVAGGATLFFPVVSNKLRGGVKSEITSIFNAKISADLINISNVTSR